MPGDLERGQTDPVRLPGDSGRLRELRLFEVADAALRLWRRGFWELSLLTAYLAVPEAALQYLYARDTRTAVVSGYVVSGNYAYPVDYTHQVSAIWLGWRILAAIALWGIWLLLGVVLCRVALNCYAGLSGNRAAATADVFRRKGRVIWTLVLGWVLTVVATVFIILPGIYMAVVMSIIVPIVALERVSGIAAVSRAHQLITRRWWATAGRVLLVWVITLGPLILLAVLIPAFLGSDNAPMTNQLHVVSSVPITATPANVLAQDIGSVSRPSTGADILIAGLGAVFVLWITPLFACFTTVIYTDLRVRAEGLTAVGLQAELLGMPGEGTAVSYEAAPPPVRATPAGPPRPPDALPPDASAPDVSRPDLSAPGDVTGSTPPPGWPGG